MGVNEDVKETIIRRDIVGVNMVSNERRFLFIDKLSSSSRLVSILFIGLEFCYLLNFRLLRELFLRLDVFMSRSLLIVDVLSLRLWPYCLSSSYYRRWW